MAGAAKKSHKLKFEVGDYIQSTYCNSPILRITAIGEINFLAIEIGDKSEMMYWRNGIFKKVSDEEVEAAQKKNKMPRSDTKREEYSDM